ncbi:hypothetical protein ACVWY0_001126 [Arthrobacter sp. UYNi723]
MSIPTGGAGGLAKAAGSGASNAAVAKSGAAAAGEAVNASGKDTGNNMAQKAGFGPGGGVGSQAAGVSPAGAAKEALDKTPAGMAVAGAKDVAKMGAGGTSAAGEPNANDGGVGKASGGDLGKVAAAGAAVPAAGAAGQLMFAMMLLNWLKTMFFSALAMAANLINMIIGVALAVGKALVGGAMAAGAAVSTFMGGAISAVTGAVAAAATTALVVGVGVVSIVSGVGNDTAQRDGGLFDCSIEIVAASDSTDAGPVGGDIQKTTENAKLVFGVLSAWGMSDENIAGILGNWDAESGVDPTGVETISGEPFTLGPKKADAESKGFDVDQIAPAYASQFPGVDLLGIGLGQWSNGRNTQLRDYAKGAGNSSWATLETQLGFMISKDSGAPVIKHMISTPIGSAKEAAVYFHHEWEKSADNSMTKRETAAIKWFAQMGGWDKNQSLADSILAQSGSTLDAANQNRVSNAQANCLTDKKAQTAGLKDGGMNLGEAKALMEKYKSEGDAVLAEAFGGGGPGDCGFGKSDNCVGFSSYFMYKFTSFKEYAAGNGIDTAASVAKMTGRETSTTPTAYSVFSMETGQPEGHTGIILGIQGDQAIIGEASCGSNHAGTRAYTRPISELTGGGFVFTDVTDLITDEAMSS